MRAQPLRPRQRMEPFPAPAPSRRCVVLPNGNRCGLGVYVAAWMTLIAMEREGRGREEIKGFEWYAEPAARILRRLREGMHDRINRHLPAYGRGRKWAQQYQIGLFRDANRVHDYVRHRVIHPINRLETPELQRRFEWRYGEDGLSIRLSWGTA